MIYHPKRNEGERIQVRRTRVQAADPQCQAKSTTPNLNSSMTKPACRYATRFIVLGTACGSTAISHTLLLFTEAQVRLCSYVDRLCNVINVDIGAEDTYKYNWMAKIVGFEAVRSSSVM
jgi:hypothetical protein